MSYDYQLFLPQPGVDPLITATAEDEDDEAYDEAAPLPPLDAAREALKRAIAGALQQAQPTLEETYSLGIADTAIDAPLHAPP